MKTFRWVKPVGFLIGILCFVFLLREIARHAELLARVPLSLRLIGTAAIAVMSWVVANLLLGVSWFFILRALRSPIDLRRALSLTLKTQIGKYLPGGVGQFAGRIILSKLRGFSARMVTYSLALEIGLVLLAAFLVSATLAIQLLRVAELRGLAVPASVVILLISALVLIQRRNRNLAWAPGSVLWSRPAIASLAASLFLLSLIFPIFGYSLWCLAGAAAFSLDSQSWELTQAFALAWMAGFVVVGAPGGLGVREAAFVLILQPQDAAAELGIIAVGYRVCGILGDAASFWLGHLIERRAVPSQRSEEVNGM